MPASPVARHPNASKKYWLLVAAALSLAATPASAQPMPAGPTPSLVGMWQAEAANNNYVIRVAWNPAAGRYEGVLVQQGLLSAQAGFTVGEILLDRDGDTRAPVSRRRRAVPVRGSGTAAARAVATGTCSLQSANPEMLLSGSTRFHRVVSFGPSAGAGNAVARPAQPPRAAAAPAAAPSPLPAAAPPAAAPGPARAFQPVGSAAAAEAAPSWPDELPAVPNVKSAVHAAGAQQDAALEVLKDYVAARAGRNPMFGGNGIPPTAMRRWEEYRNAQSVRRVGNAVLANSLAPEAEPYFRDPAFRVRVLTAVLSPPLVAWYRGSPAFRELVAASEQRQAAEGEEQGVPGEARRRRCPARGDAAVRCARRQSRARARDRSRGVWHPDGRAVRCAGLPRRGRRSLVDRGRQPEPTSQPCRRLRVRRPGARG